jgi:lysophospholipase L1-like esterase
MIVMAISVLLIPLQDFIMRPSLFLSRMTAALTLASLCQFSSALAPQTLSGTQPAKRTQEYPWMTVATWDRMHAEDLLVAQHDEVDVLFVGDSITAGWAPQIWETQFKPLKAANFGIGGDGTGNVLWRLQHGAIGNLQPKVVVLMIGVNNFARYNETPEQVAAGIGAVVQQLQLAWPSSKILLNAVFPCDEKATGPRRPLIKQVNSLIAQLNDNKRIFFKDYGPLMLQKDGSISPEIMRDFLHPTPKGYQLWADAMLPDIQTLLAEQ